MYRPTIQSNLWLGIIAVVFILLSYWSDHSRVPVRPPDWQTRKLAAETMLKSLQVLQDYRFPEGQGSGVKNGVDSMLIVYTMLGEKDSPITTDEGRLEDKITVLNPNFAAVLVDMLGQAGVKKGDSVACMLTGSMPGANIAMFAAARAMELKLVTISSIGSSWWGANTPDFTWLDMERVLVDNGIYPDSYRSIAASAGGSDDNGGLRLSALGKKLIIEAVDRNHVTLIETENLTGNINARIKMLNGEAPLRNYKALVNIGGGIAAMGHSSNAGLIPDGVNLTLPDKNYPSKLSVVHSFANDNIPVIHLFNIPEIAALYGLPVSQLPLPEVGKGRVYEYERYDMTSATIALILMFLILAVVKYFDWKKYQWREQKVDMNTID